MKTFAYWDFMHVSSITLIGDYSPKSKQRIVV